MKAHKHGHAGNEQHPLYTVWAQMLSRCSCPTANGYERYGGRGIKVCERWRTSFEDFLADMGPRPTPRHTLDRFPDNDGDYEPGNVRWATPAEQNRNKRSNRLLTHDGVTRCLTDWATTTGLSAGTITMRLQLGWTVADALSEPAHPKRKANTFTHNGETLHVSEWAARLGVSPTAILHRLSRGWSVALALTTPPDKSKVPFGRRK